MMVAFARIVMFICPLCQDGLSTLQSGFLPVSVQPIIKRDAISFLLRHRMIDQYHVSGVGTRGDGWCYVRGKLGLMQSMRAHEHAGECRHELSGNIQHSTVSAADGSEWLPLYL